LGRTGSTLAIGGKELAMDAVIRTGKAVWAGALRDGAGRITTESGALQEVDYSAKTRFEQKPGTNPEELIAAAHAACYSMALAHALAEDGYAPERIETDARCTLEPADGGYRITSMSLTSRVRVEGVEESEMETLASAADDGCPVSNLLRKGLSIERDVSLMSGEID
jgi:osmotically inducible protein OsmC